MPEEGIPIQVRNDDPTNLFTGRSIDEIGAIERKIRSGKIFFRHFFIKVNFISVKHVYFSVFGP